MKVSDFVKGKWYITNILHHTIALKFEHETEMAFVFSQSISYDGIFNNYSSVLTKRNYPVSSYIEVETEEIIKYLPKDHSDVIEYNKSKLKFIPGRWYKSNQFSNVVAVKFKSLQNEEFESCETIFLRKKRIEKSKVSWNKRIYPLRSFKEVSLEELKEYIPIVHEDYEKIETFKYEFPLEGCSENTPQLLDYIVNKIGAINRNRIYDSSRPYLKWFTEENVKYFTFLAEKSLHVKYYKQLEIDELIKTNKNENKNSTTEVCGTSSEIERSIGKGTIAMGCGRQQASIRGGLVGNISRSIQTTTKSIKNEISPKVGQRSNS